MEKLQPFLNDSKYILATNFHRRKVVLALLFKALTTAQSRLYLGGGCFNGDAFGLSRTLTEIYLTTRC